MRWGDKKNQDLFKVLREDGVPHPADNTRPALRGDCIDYYDAFRFLGASRMWNQVGPQPIPVSEIMSYLTGMGVTNLEDRERYLRHIKDMDNLELTRFQEKRANSK